MDGTTDRVVHGLITLANGAIAHGRVDRPEVLQGHDVLPLSAAIFPAGLLARIGGPNLDPTLGDWWPWELLQRAVWHGGLAAVDVVVGHAAGAPARRGGTAVPPMPRAIASARLRSLDPPPFVDDVARSFGPAHAPYSAPHSARPSGPATRLPLVIYGRLDASSSLYVDALLSDPTAPTVLLLDETSPAADAPLLAEAGAVVLVRDAPRFVANGLLDLLDTLGVPAWYFTDDDFAALRAEHAGLAAFQDSTMERLAARCAGVLTTSEHLAQALQQRHPGADVRQWPMALDPSLQCAHGARREEWPRGALRVGVMGGAFRAPGVHADMLPALLAHAEATAKEPSVELFVREELASAFAGLACHAVPFTRSFRGFVRTWQDLDLDAVLHPAATTANAAGKTPNALLVAHYLGAVPVVSSEPAYAAFTDQHGVLVCSDTSQWRAALERIADPEEANVLRQRLAGHVADAYPSHRAAEVAASVLGDVDIWDARIRLVRQHALVAWLAEPRPVAPATPVTAWPSRRRLLRHPVATLRWLATGRSPEMP